MRSVLNSGAAEPVSGTVGGGAAPDSAIWLEVRAVAGGADAGSVFSADVRAVAASAGAGSVVCRDVRAVTAGADGDRVSVLVSSAPDDASSRSSVATVSDRRSFIDVRRSCLRNRRHVSEPCSAAAVLGPTAGLAPSASAVSTSSCPVMGNPLRT
jgi:hypothetical protein